MTRRLLDETEPDFAAFLRRHAPELTKVLVRYYPDGDAAANAIQRRFARTFLSACASGN